MKNPSIFIIRRNGEVNFVETWSTTPAGDGVHHRTFRTVEEARAWFRERGIVDPVLRERPY
jgi:hypothetical protein